MFTPTHKITGKDRELAMHPELEGIGCIVVTDPAHKVALNASRVILEDYSIKILFNDQLEPIEA